ncbi:MAG: hypothetical protein NXH79_13685 [Rhodobacteraceae bacterium]|nr:hypothetical protein [Paracoccaceae bacterium]
MDMLTVREHFALTLLASLTCHDQGASLSDLAPMAVDGADALIAELNRRQGGGKPL